MQRCNRWLFCGVLVPLCGMGSNAVADDALTAQAARGLRQAAAFYSEQVAAHGGYVYHYLPDLSRRWGEGEATRDQIWVQPPGTPTVGMAYLKAYEATGDRYYLEAATAAAEALVYGQISTGGWTNCIDFDPQGKRVAQYRNGKGRGRDVSSLDDGQSSSAIRFLVQLDGAVEFQNRPIHESVRFALDALLAAQFPNGAFPQVWRGPVAPQPVKKASYPSYDWRTEGRVKNYWDMYTLNDNVPGYVLAALVDAHRIYGDDRYLTAIRKLGDFLILAQMPEPQPGWAQQYSYEMHPIWARAFEPPGLSGDETQESIENLMTVYAVTGDEKYLTPIPTALEYLKRSLLPDGRLARYYELKTNRPLYMQRSGERYSLTYDDSNLPSHYGYKTESRLDELQRRYERMQRGSVEPAPPSLPQLERDVRKVLGELDQQGRWLSVSTGERLVGQLVLPKGTKYLSSEQFARNVTLLSEFLQASRK